MDENKPPNGVLIYHDENTGRWILSANRFVSKVVSEEAIADMVRLTRQMNDVPPEISDEDIRERVLSGMDVTIGDTATALESANREVASLEEGAQIATTLWAWLMGLEETPPESTLEISGVSLALSVLERNDLTAEDKNRLRKILG